MKYKINRLFTIHSEGNCENCGQALEIKVSFPEKYLNVEDIPLSEIRIEVEEIKDIKK